MRKHWRITMKEVGREKPIVSEHISDATESYLISFYGLKEPDVEWYRIEDVTEEDDSDKDREAERRREAMKEMFEKAYNGSYYTVTGCGGDIEEWKKGYSEMVREEGIGEIAEFVTFTGKDMNEAYQLGGTNAYLDDLVFLAFPIDGLHVGRLAIFKLKMHDHWFDDIVDNNRRRQEEGCE